MLKYSEIKTKTKDQLEAIVLDSKKELMNLRFQQTSGTLANTSRLKIVRKKIAKIKTLLNNDQPKNKKRAGVKIDA